MLATKCSFDRRFRPAPFIPAAAHEKKSSKVSGRWPVHLTRKLRSTTAGAGIRGDVSPFRIRLLAWRFRNPDDETGKQDFIVARTNADGNEFVPSYHWACAIDDYDGDHSLLVRAWDLAHVIPQQRSIHAWVGANESRPRVYPAVFHCSLIVDNNEHRLEKRTRGVTLDELKGAGTRVEELLVKFQRSFDSKLIQEFAPGKIWGERAEQLRLQEAGF